jgi:DMSO/TMAO reductase YedYZ molybdopterin-dependent catalytic subunit
VTAVGRRVFLAGVAASAALVVAGDGIPGALRKLVEAPLSDLSPGDGFHFYSVTGSIPASDSNWRLEVDGLVDSPLSLRIADLFGGSTEVHADFHCVSGWSVAGVRWRGAPLSDLLDASRPRPQARALRLESADGAYVDYLDLGVAREANVLIAHSINGRPLTPERGAPARLVVPFYYGYKGVKWLRRISAVEAPGTGYWEARGYDADARIRD